MNPNLKSCLFLIAVFFMGYSCTKINKAGIMNTGNYPSDGPSLQSNVNFPVGVAVDYLPLTSDQTYAGIVAQNFGMIVPGYEMKHHAVVRDNGTYDFSRADQIVDFATQNGLKVYGHTLVWHQNQNGVYLNSLISGSGGSDIVNLISNPGFENGLNGWSVLNTGDPGGSSTIAVTNNPSEVRSGGSAVKVTVDKNYGTSQWRVQFQTPSFAAQNGKTYNVSFWIKAASAGGSMRLSAAPDNTAVNAYQGDQDGIGTDWMQITWNFTMKADNPTQKVSFDMGKTADTYFIDDVQVWDPNAEPAPPLLTNGGFENGTTGWDTFNSGDPAGSSSVAITNTPSEVRSGTQALKIVVDKDYGTSQWRVQEVAPPFAAENGKTYTVSFWIKAANPGGSVRLSANPTNTVTNAYQGDQDGIGTDWQQIVWSITMTADAPAQRISFDIGKVANTYFIDDVVIQDNDAGGGNTGGGDDAEKIDEAMKDFITTMVTRYKDKVKAWDVVNEPLVESGAIRTSANTTIPSNADKNDYFFWSDYLGRDYALKAFQYAAAANPDADLFINDYNLESNPTKLDSLIAYVQELKGKGAKIDGIGTQMHVNNNTSYDGIDAMFIKLAATGLKIRISELDVRINMVNKPDYQFINIPAPVLGMQADMYHYVVSSYLKHIPEAQRAGIVVWGVNDANSWLYKNGTDFPLLYDVNYNKKPAFGAFSEALQNR